MMDEIEDAQIADVLEQDREWWARFWARREAVQRQSRREAGVWDDTE